MISATATYATQITQRFPTTTEDSSEIPFMGQVRPASSTSSLQGQETVSISDQGKELSAKNSVNSSAGVSETDKSKTASVPEAGKQNDKAQNASSLAEIQQMKNRDTHVRAHEQAHLSVAGRYASGGASYTYETGPDGVRYAVGGEVPIDISSESTPEATIQKMETIKRAALAPSDPSAADRQIAAEALSKELNAMQELQSLQQEKTGSNTTAASTNLDNTPTTSPSSSDTSAVASAGLPSGNNRQAMLKAYQDMLTLA